MITVKRYHDICAGHRVYKHEGKCANLHGHGYRIHFTCTSGGLDEIGRIIDFGEINKRLCGWLEENWDHRFLIWENDPALKDLTKIDKKVVSVPFNPTAENMAVYLVEKIGPEQLYGSGAGLVEVTVEETPKCQATFSIK